MSAARAAPGTSLRGGAKRARRAASRERGRRPSEVRPRRTCAMGRRAPRGTARRTLGGDHMTALEIRFFPVTGQGRNWQRRAIVHQITESLCGALDHAGRVPRRIQRVPRASATALPEPTLAAIRRCARDALLAAMSTTRCPPPSPDGGQLRKQLGAVRGCAPSAFPARGSLRSGVDVVMFPRVQRSFLADRNIFQARGNSACPRRTLRSRCASSRATEGDRIAKLALEIRAQSTSWRRITVAHKNVVFALGCESLPGGRCASRRRLIRRSCSSGNWSTRSQETWSRIPERYEMVLTIEPVRRHPRAMSRPRKSGATTVPIVNANDDIAVFCPTHDAFDDIAGKGRVNPLPDAADRIGDVALCKKLDPGSARARPRVVRVRGRRVASIVGPPGRRGSTARRHRRHRAGPSPASGRATARVRKHPRALPDCAPPRSAASSLSCADRQRREPANLLLDYRQLVIARSVLHAFAVESPPPRRRTVTRAPRGQALLPFALDLLVDLVRIRLLSARGCAGRRGCPQVYSRSPRHALHQEQGRGVELALYCRSRQSPVGSRITPHHALVGPNLQQPARTSSMASSARSHAASRSARAPRIIGWM